MQHPIVIINLGRKLLYDSHNIIVHYEMPYFTNILNKINNK